MPLLSSYIFRFFLLSPHSIFLPHHHPVVLLPPSSFPSFSPPPPSRLNSHSAFSSILLLHPFIPHFLSLPHYTPSHTRFHHHHVSTFHFISKFCFFVFFLFLHHVPPPPPSLPPDAIPLAGEHMLSPSRASRASYNHNQYRFTCGIIQLYSARANYSRKSFAIAHLGPAFCGRRPCP